jgi:hypothetical protein
MASNLSGKEWWKSNQGKYPNSKSVDDLESGFKSNVVKFMGLLKTAGAKISISSTRRDANRAFLMHYCWKVANEEIEASAVPGRSNVAIVWDHGNKEDSIKGAKEMVELFGIKFKPSLTSNHIKGTAVDMTITWSGELSLGPLPDGTFKNVDGPSNGSANKELHAIGYQYGVRKLIKDPPHWSADGK